MRHDHQGWRKFKSGLASTLSTVAALLVIAPLGLVFFYLLQKGAGAVNWDFFTQLPKPVGEAGGGMANAIVGTLELLGLASCIGIPVGVLGGVFLSEYATAAGNWWLRFVADVLNGVPSITWCGGLRPGRVAVQEFLRLRGRARPRIHDDPSHHVHDRRSAPPRA
jgi:phosphate transport system permease protein